MDMHDFIREHLANIEGEQGVRVLFAVESGSRAWGFASPDSDWDVRFVYVHPLDWYVQVGERPDTIERQLPRDLDVAGWELRKALRLFSKCNLAFNEWLGSPIVYTDREGMRGELAALMPQYLNVRKGMFHYLAIANGYFEEIDSAGSLKIKRAFYILRPLLAALWLRDRRTMPPTSFHDLRAAKLLPADVEAEVDDLLERKKSAVEGQVITLPPGLLDWIRSTRHEVGRDAHAAPTLDGQNFECLDALLRRRIYNP